MAAANIIVTFFCLFHYVFGLGHSSFGLHDLTASDREMLYNGAPPPPSEDKESVQDFIKRQYRDEQLMTDEPINYLRQRVSRNYNNDDRIPGPPGIPNMPSPPGMPSMPGPPGMSNMPGFPGNVRGPPGMPNMPGFPGNMPGPPGMPNMPGFPGNVRGPPGMPNIPGRPGVPNAPNPPGMQERLIAGRFRPGSPYDQPSPLDWNVPGRSPNYRDRPSPLQELQKQEYTGTKKEAAHDINVLGPRLTAAGKWEEFIQLANEVKKKNRDQPPQDWESEALSLAQYSRNLVSSMPKPTTTTSKPIARAKYYQPSPGMAAYWNPDDRPKPATPKTKPAPRQPARVMMGQDVMKLALTKLAELQAAEDSKSQAKPATMVTQQNVTNATGLVLASNDTDKLKNLPMFLPAKGSGQMGVTMKGGICTAVDFERDDFNSPIRWVPLYSKETSDGLARVTDPNTGKNQQYVIGGSVMVPVIDYSLERLGLTSTTTVRVPQGSDPGALRTIVKNLDPKNADERDWLAYEIVLGGRKYDNRCDGEGCQARCNRLGCESQCSGDTCASGCVGGSCSTMCSGPGCLSMCIGENCSAKCNGMSCEARCRGKNCEASCRSFSCTQITNGMPSMGGGTFNQHYPQYSESRGEYSNYYTSY